MFHRHFNRAMGKFVHTKEDYLKNMKDMKLIPEKEANKIADKRTQRKPYDKPSDNAMKFMTHVQNKREKNGKIKLNGREIAEMKRLGVSFRRVEGPLKGGF